MKVLAVAPLALSLFTLWPVVVLGDTQRVAFATQMRVVRNELVDHFGDVQRRSGLAVTLETRLDEDAGFVSYGKTDRLSDSDFREISTLVVKLDTSLVDQLATGKYHAIGAIRGADEVLVKSPADGTMQPVGVYVPAGVDPAKPVPLVVFLHGRTQTDGDMIAGNLIRKLAESTGAIMIAPYARGDIQYADPAPQDVYAAADAAISGFNIDRKRIYLAGYSMGGFGVFEVGPAHADLWRAFLCISGSLTNDDQKAVTKTFGGKTVYVVTGSDDNDIPSEYSKKTADYLSYVGIPVRYYVQSHGTHQLSSIYAVVTQAWKDMLNGINGASIAGRGGPQAAPPALPIKSASPT